MKIYLLQLATALAFLLGITADSQELFQNNNWVNMKGNTPANWRFFTYKGKSDIKIANEKYKNKKVTVISSDKQKGMGYVGQFSKVQFPAGKNIVLSGYYRTENIALDSKGKMYANIGYNHGSKNKNFPRKYQSVLFKPSEKWKRFESLRAINVPVKNFFALFMLYHGSGKLYLSGLSLKVQESSCKINPKEKYIWREGEDIVDSAHVSTWGNKIKDYYSGKGGIILKGSPFKWNFRIKEEVNASTLMPEKRNYFVWFRMYGYMDKPAVSVFFNKNKISSFKTHANEQVKNGRYAGPGKYYWQKAGSFSAVGGNHSLKVVPQGRMLLDAVVVTTDSKYAPVDYEARKVADKTFLIDVKNPYMIKSVFKVYGISDKVTTPIKFRYHGKVVKIPAEQKPAVLHISIPAGIIIKNVSSHWAGKNWNSPSRWGEKYTTWKKAGTETVSGVKYNKYEIYLYYLSLTYDLFVQADKADFQPGHKLSCRYYLEYKGKKQLVETLPLRTVALKPAKAFKTIMIGPAGGNCRSFYEEFPEIAKDMVFSGLNIINAWHTYPDRDGIRWKKFRDQCIKNKIAILGEYTPFYGTFGIKDKKYQAVSIKGKAESHRPALGIDEASKSFRKTLKHLADQGRQGVTGMVFDDENFNQQKDKFDYNLLTIEKFKKYCAAKGINYIDPKLIVKDKKKYAAQYKVWVDFKCDCMVDMYRKFKKAYLQGIAETPSFSTLDKKLFIAQILKNNSPEESRVNTYWDYKKLATVCDYISPMLYTYEGVKGSARVGDIVEMYNNYIGKKVITPTLLCEHSGFGDVDMTQKKMFKYQILESLMQQSKIIFFWYGSSVYNPVNTQYISEAIRWASPYEDIILNGKKFNRVISPKWVRARGLKLNKRILLYLANYRNSISKKAKIKFKSKIKSVLEIGTGKQLPVQNNSFSMDFKSDRGKLFLIITTKR